MLAPKIETLFNDAGRCKAAEGVWLVRSDSFTTSEVVADLGIPVGELSGIVIRAELDDGVANRSIVQKLAAWERE